MTLINNNFFNLQENYLFSIISRKVKIFKDKNPDKHLINMGIGDVTRPIPNVSILAMHKAVDELSNSETFKGYGPEQGYSFLREKISKYDYKNLDISADEIFISDGVKCDLGRISFLFDSANTVGIPNPVYPVYLDTNIISGRSRRFNIAINNFEKVFYLNMDENNNFVPTIPNEKIDLIYLCSPNNPTGTTLSKENLQKWVNYALHNNSIILFDSAYESFITDSNIPHSIYEISDAKKVAIEFRSFSKTAGFTGLRCAYTVIPNDLKINNSKIIDLYRRLFSTIYNGTSYVSQRAAEALYSSQGSLEIAKNIAYYMNNAFIIKNALTSLGFTCFGAKNSPYIWIKVPNKMNSWNFFDILLEQVNIVGTPGCGFGSNGEGFFRLTGFNSFENTQAAVERLKKIF